MEKVFFDFVKEFGVGVSVVAVLLIVLWRVAPEWVKARIENEKDETSARIERTKAETETIRRVSEAVSTGIPSALADLAKSHAVEAVQTRGHITEAASEIKAHVTQEIDKRMEAKVDDVRSLLARKPCDHHDHSPNTERASVRGLQTQP